TDVWYRSTRTCTATVRNARKTVTPAIDATRPVPRSGLLASVVADLVDLVADVVLGVAPDRVEADPHGGSEERHDQHGDRRRDHAFAPLGALHPFVLHCLSSLF